MSAALSGMLLVVLGFVLVPVSVLLLQVICAAMRRRPAPMPKVVRPRLAVLVPAHNESQGIRGTLDSVLPQLKQGDRLVVIADNCSDDTAQVAAGSGAEVVERHDASRRGKGYALDFGVRHLERDPPQQVVIVDADCEVTAGAIDRIARMSASTGRPVQALYLMKSPQSAGAMAPIAEFAGVVKNLVRPLGFLRLGLPCQLMGSGMAFPWAAIRSAQLASGHIVEDMKMGVDFSRAGVPPLFCPEALVRSYFPGSEDGTRNQRTRWEHGHLGMIVGEAPRLLWEGVRGNGSGLLALALDLCVPPLALLTLTIIALLAVSAAHALLTLAIAPLAMAGVISLMFGAAVGLSWLRFGSGILPFGQLLLAFAYAFRKIPLYLKFVIGRQVEWVRSTRDKPLKRQDLWSERWTMMVGRIRVVHSPSEETALLHELATAKTAREIGFVNAHAMNSVAASPAFFDELASADILLRDGSGMSLLYRKRAAAAGLNMNGTDFIPKILGAFIGRRVALWGTAEPFLGNCASRCETEFGVNVVSRENGFQDPGHYVDLAAKVMPDLIVLGMGMPKQEHVARLIRSRVPGAALVVCGGAIIDFLGGKISRAPGWMRRSGMEWIYRLVREPRRLFSRYVVGNPVFVFRLLGWHPERGVSG